MVPPAQKKKVRLVEVLLVPQLEDGVVTGVLARTSDAHIPILTSLSHMETARGRLQHVMRNLGLSTQATPHMTIHRDVLIWSEVRDLAVTVLRIPVGLVRANGYSFAPIERVEQRMGFEPGMVQQLLGQSVLQQRMILEPPLPQADDVDATEEASTVEILAEPRFRRNADMSRIFPPQSP